MPRCVQWLRRFCKFDSGATAVEYTVLVAFFLLVVVAGVRTLGKTVGDTMSNAAQSISNAPTWKSSSAERTVREGRNAFP